MLQDPIRNQFLSAFTSLLGNLKRDSNGVVTHLVEVLVRVAESAGGDSAVEILASGLLHTGFMHRLLEGLRESWEAHQSTDPNRSHTSVEGVVETDYLSVLARLSLASPSVFVATMRAAAASRGEDSGTLPQWILTEWFSHFGNIGDLPKKKLMCLALTKLLTTGQLWILEKLQDLITVWTDVITELQEGAEDFGGELVLPSRPGS